MKQYIDLANKILKEGQPRNDRTGTGTLEIFGHQMRFDLSKGFPLLTTKKLSLKAIIHELLWFLKGDTNTKYLKENGVRIWNEWEDENGDLGPIYGHQWRKWSNVEIAYSHTSGKAIGIQQYEYDQINNIINEIKTNRESRRLIVNSWNVGDIGKMALPPCHLLFQFYVTNDNKLSCQLYQRSADVFLGVPFNIASYALLTMMIAQVCGLEPGEFIHTTGATHIYTNHIEQMKEQVSRKPKPLPTMTINPNVKSIDEFRFEDFKLVGYEAHPHIKGDVSI